MNQHDSQSMIFFASVFVILTLTTQVNGNENWKGFSKKLFQLDGKQIHQSEVLDNLKQLKVLLENENEQRAVALREEVEHLIYISAITPDKCRPEDFRRLRSDIEHYESRSSKLFYYLTQCQEEQFRDCKSILANELKEAVNKLDAQIRSSVADLASSIELPAEAANIWLPSRANLVQYSRLIAVGVLDYLERSAGHRFSSRSKLGGEARKKRTFLKRFEQNVGNLCRIIMISVDPQTSAFQHLYHADKLLTELDKRTLDWVERIRVCHFIFVLGGSVGFDAFAELVNRDNKGEINNSINL